MYWDKFSRRHFLQGAGGFALGLPSLFSLLPKEAQAQAQNTIRPNLVVMHNEHGACDSTSMYPHINPNDSRLSITNFLPAQNGNPVHTFSMGDILNLKSVQNTSQVLINQDFDNGASRYSPVFGSFMSDNLLAKMNQLRGLDLMYYGSHHRGILGNFHHSDRDEVREAMEPIPSIDWVIKNSERFYPRSEYGSLISRSVNVSFSDSNSFGDPKVGQEPLPDLGRTQQSTFNYLFNPRDRSSDRLVVDKLLGDYRNFSSRFNAGRRISSADKEKLERFFYNLYETERKVNAIVQCPQVSIPSAQSLAPNNHRWYGTINILQNNFDVLARIIALAFECGNCRIATIGLPPSVSHGDYHQGIAHQARSSGPQTTLVEGHRFIAQHFYANLGERLNSISDGNSGHTLLDRSLILWSAEAGIHTHHTWSLPCNMLGGSRLGIVQGKYIDYRSQNNLSIGDPHRPGLLWNQLLVSVAQTMGLSPSDYERVDSQNQRIPGYGGIYKEPRTRNGHHAWPENGVIDQRGNFLPLLRA